MIIIIVEFITRYEMELDKELDPQQASYHLDS